MRPRPLVSPTGNAPGSYFSLIHGGPGFTALPRYIAVGLLVIWGVYLAFRTSDMVTGFGQGYRASFHSDPNRPR